MKGDDDFTPRLGRIGDCGSANVKRASKRIRQAAARLLKMKRARAFTGKRIGAGTAAARMTQVRSSAIPKFRMRRVVVKVFIARAGKGSAAGAFGAHLRYIERDGVDRDGAAGRLYDRNGDEADRDAFRARSEEDERQFRLIVSPEDGAVFGDLKENTRTLMARVEQDLGKTLDWVAVDHFNTGMPHSHVVIRGRDCAGRDLVVARDYLMEGLRHRASDLMTEQLGPRRDLEILRSRSAEFGRDRFTSIDRDIAARSLDGRVQSAPARTARERFDGDLALRRLRHLESLSLAERAGRGEWRLEPGWEEALKGLGRRDDIIRNMIAELGARARPASFEIFDPGAEKTVVGRIAAIGRTDEMRDDRFLVLEATDGRHLYVEIGNQANDWLPGKEGIIEVSPPPRTLRPSDQTISRIARANAGRYSDELHRLDDPYSTSEFRQAHKRRLEALRRDGVVERSRDGVWRIGPDYLKRAAAVDRKREGGVSVKVASWRRLEEIIEARAVIWLDDVDLATLGATGFGGEARAAQVRRTQWLRAQGLLGDEAISLSATARAQLDREEVSEIGSKEARRTGRKFQRLASGQSFEGVFERTIDGAARRFAVIGSDGTFTLAVWRPEFDSQRLRQLTVTQTLGRATWQVATGVDRHPNLPFWSIEPTN